MWTGNLLLTASVANILLVPAVAVFACVRVAIGQCRFAGGWFATELGVRVGIAT
jgi:hypothetical protein